MKRDVKIDIDNNIQLRTLMKIDVTEKYVAWLNDYEIMKYTEQKYFAILCSLRTFLYNKAELNNKPGIELIVRSNLIVLFA